MIGNAGNEKPNKAERLAFTQTDHEKLIEEAERGNRAIEAREHRSLFEAAAREQLIGEAATAILTSEGIEQQEDGTYWGENTWPNAVKDAATAMAVFEKALAPTDDESIEWRPVVGYEGIYEVSEAGDVRSIERTIMRSNGAEQAVTEKLLTKHPDRRGYHLVSLTSEHKAVHRRVHRLVLEAFVGPCPEGHEALHGDGDMHNNHRSNLRWGTRTENVHDSMRHGTLPVGEHAAASKVTERDVRDIRAAHAAGASIRGLSKKYKLALSTMQAIVHRRSWKHVN